MRRYLSLLLVLSLLAIVAIVAVSGEDKKAAPAAKTEDKSKVKETTPKPADKSKDKKKEEEEKEEKPKTPPGPSLANEKNPCKDASHNKYEEIKDLKDPEVEHQATFAVFHQNHYNKKKLELIKIDKAEKRPGCGMYYYMTLEYEDNDKNGKDSQFDCEFFNSEYDRHVVFCGDQDNTTIGDPKDKNKCQDASKNKYEDVKDPNSVQYFAHLAILEHSAMEKRSLEFEKVVKAKKRPGCGMYYRMNATIKDQEKGGKTGTYEIECYTCDSYQQVVTFRPLFVK